MSYTPEEHYDSQLEAPSIHSHSESILTRDTSVKSRGTSRSKSKRTVASSSSTTTDKKKSDDHEKSIVNGRYVLRAGFKMPVVERDELLPGRALESIDSSSTRFPEIND
jgi:hypothetical protein